MPRLTHRTGEPGFTPRLQGPCSELPCQAAPPGAGWPQRLLWRHLGIGPGQLHCDSGNVTATGFQSRHGVLGGGMEMALEGPAVHPGGVRWSVGRASMRGWATGPGPGAAGQGVLQSSPVQSSRAWGSWQGDKSSSSLTSPETCVSSTHCMPALVQALVIDQFLASQQRLGLFHSQAAGP